MKLIIQSLLFLIAFSFFSCSTVEEIWINKDGSLKREVKIDVSAIVPFMKMDPGAMGMEEMEQDSTMEDSEMAEAEEEDKDFFAELMKREHVDTLIPLRNVMMEQMKKEGMDMSMDNLMQKFQEESEEEMSEEEKKTMVGFLEMLMASTMRIKMSEKDNEYFFGLIQDFESAKELNSGSDIFSMIGKLAQMGGDGPGAPPEAQEMFDMLNTGTPEYTLTKRTFEIYRAPVDFSSLMPEDSGGEMEMLKAFMGGMEYTYVIHVPKKVKKVNIEGAKIDGNTVTFSVPVPGFGEGDDEGLDLKMKYK